VLRLNVSKLEALGYKVWQSPIFVDIEVQSFFESGECLLMEVLKVKWEDIWPQNIASCTLEKILLYFLSDARVIRKMQREQAFSSPY
jgi:hypothetical protein